MTKIIISSLCFLAFGFFSNAQTETGLVPLEGTYQLIQKTDVIEEGLQMVNLQMLDLYRSENADNTVTIERNGEMITITLLSAAKCRQLGQAFDEELVQKGKLMGTNPTISESFILEVDPELRLTEKN